MSKAPSPLLGYNNNVRHKNRTFHIQTEDSGVKHPHIITHLFMDGGRILKSLKTSYAEHIGETKMADTVRQMMKDQHKSVFIALRDGQYDPLIDAALGLAPAAEVPPAAASPSVDAPKRKSQRPPASGRTIPAPAPEDMGPSDSVPRPHISDLPPPPANLFAKAPATETRYRSQGAPEDHVPSRKGSSRSPSGRPARRSSAPPSAGRYGSTRPASIFGASRSPKAASIFGEDLISDKSLDEVILSYLAEDLETETKK